MEELELVKTIAICGFLIVVTMGVLRMYEQCSDNIIKFTTALGISIVVNFMLTLVGVQPVTSFTVGFIIALIFSQFYTRDK